MQIDSPHIQRNPLSLLRYNKERDGDMLYLLTLQRQYREFFRRVPIGSSREWVVDFENNTESQIYWVIHKESPYDQIGLVVLTKFCPFGLTVHGGVLTLSEYQDRYFYNRKYSFWATLALVQMMFEDTLFRQIYFRFLKKRADIVESFQKAGMSKVAEYPDSIYYDGEWESEVEYVMQKIVYLESFKKNYGR